MYKENRITFARGRFRSFADPFPPSMPTFFMPAFKKMFFRLFFEAITGISVFPAQYFPACGAKPTGFQAGFFRETICL